MIRNIGVDITNLDPDYYGGSDTYSNGLINGLTKINSKYNFQIYLRKNYFKKRKLSNKININHIPFEYTFFELSILKIYNRLFPIVSIFLGNYKFKADYHIRNYINQRLTNIIEKNSDVLLIPNVLLPSYNLKIKTILNIQDIQHIHYPNFFSKIENLRRKYLYFNSLKYSSNLICSSNFIRKDIKKNFNLKNKKIKIIEEGVNIDDFKKKIKKKIKYKNFFFFPAQLWQHKNHLLVIKAFNIFNKKFGYKYKLIICGKSFRSSEKILNKINQTRNCYYLGVISKNSLIHFYKKSIATISPALYESSSLTILEALVCGSKIIASNTEPNLERKKFNVLFFKKNSYKSLVNQFTKSLLNSKSRINKKKSIKEFDWKNISKQWLKVAI